MSGVCQMWQQVKVELIYSSSMYFVVYFFLIFFFTINADVKRFKVIGINIDDIQLGVEFASSDYGDNEAFLNIENGEIHFVGDVVDEIPPSDLYENEKYVQLPSKVDLDLGKRLAINFIVTALPGKLDETYLIFSRKGAYSRFKSMLVSAEKLENWYAYEDAESKKAILDWCNSIGMDVK